MTVRRLALVVLLILLSSGTLASAKAPPRTVEVAAIQFNPQFGQLAPNVKRLAEQLEAAARKGAKILVAPEMATTGYLYGSREEIKPFVEPIPGKTTNRFAQIARKHSCYIAWGMPEVDPDTRLYYNSMALVGPKGYIGKYRKTHLWEAEAHWAASGNLGMPVFETPLGNLALIICQDANYMETFRLAVLGKADIVCFATNSSGQTVARLQARAIQNGLYVIGANRSNTEKDFRMRGCSAVWSPLGKKLAEASLDKEEILYATVDRSLYVRKKELLGIRRPELYLELIRHIAPWNYKEDRSYRRVQAVALQYEPILGDKKKNRSTVERMLAKQSWQIRSFSRRRTLIVLPELSFTGHVAPDRMGTLAERMDGESVTFAKGLAKRYHSYLVFGLAEKDKDGKTYNSVVLVSPDGEVLGKARKTHLDDHDRRWASPGKRVRVFATKDLGRVGLLVGSDAFVPECGTMLAIERAKLVAIPSSWNGQLAGQEIEGNIQINPRINPHAKMGGMVLWDNLAWEHVFYAVVANSVGGKRGDKGQSGVYSLDPIYDLRSPALAGLEQKERAVVGIFDTRRENHWTSQEQYIGSRRAAGALYYPLIRRSKPGG